MEVLLQQSRAKPQQPMAIEHEEEAPASPQAQGQAQGGAEARFSSSSPLFPPPTPLHPARGGGTGGKRGSMASVLGSEERPA